MGEEIGIEIGPQCKQEEHKKHPGVTGIARSEEVERQGQIERHKKEETVEAHVSAEALEVGADSVGAVPVQVGLHEVIELLLRRQVTMGDGLGLKSETRGNTVLIAA